MVVILLVIGLMIGGAICLVMGAVLAIGIVIVIGQIQVKI